MDFSLIARYSWWFLLLCILTGASFSFFLYRKDKKLQEAGKTVKILLFISRFLSVFLISIYLLSPFVKNVSTTIQKPIIILAHDNSQSILYDTNINEQYKKNIEDLISKISKYLQVKEYSFGQKLKPGISYDFTDKETDISTAVQQINETFYGDNVGAVILASDGIYNRGNNPIYETENLKFPVYTIAIGDSAQIKDISVKHVKHNKIAFLNNVFPLQISLNATKFKGRKTSLRVLSGKTELYKKEININADNFFEKIDVEIKALKKGIMPLRIVVNSINEEKNINNNIKDIVVEVIDTKQKILILAHSPHPDIAAIRNSLATNQNFETEYFLYNEFNKSLKEYNLIILHQLPSKTNAATNILAQITKTNIPALYIIGKQSDISAINSLNAGLKISKGSGTFDDLNGYLNSDFKLFDINKSISEIAEQAPPLLSPFGDYNILPNADVMFFSKIKGIETKRPLLFFNNFKLSSGSKNAFIAGEGIWRWKLFDYKINNNHYLFDEFINKTVKFLTLKQDKDRFRVKYEKLVQENRDIIFDAERYNKSYELITDADVNLIIIDSLSVNYNFIFDKSANSYSLNIGNLPAGKYSWKAETLIDDEKVYKTGSFSVLPVNIETDNMVANHQILNQLAIKTGGKIFYPQNINNLADTILNDNNIVPVSYSEKNTSDFINFKFMFFIILALLTYEWLMRKLYGTI